MVVMDLSNIILLYMFIVEPRLNWLKYYYCNKQLGLKKTRFDKFMGRLPICLSSITPIHVRYQDTKNSDTNLSIRVVKHGILYLDPTSTSI